MLFRSSREESGIFFLSLVLSTAQSPDSSLLLFSLLSDLTVGRSPPEASPISVDFPLQVLVLDDQATRGLAATVPFRHGIHLSKKMCPSTPEEIERMSKIPYASVIGSLMYAMLCIRPDIAHAMSVTSRYQSNPGEEHWTSMKCILKYLRRTKDMFLVFGNGELQVQRFIDSDFMSDIDDRKSISGSLFICNGGTVS